MIGACLCCGNKNINATKSNIGIWLVYNGYITYCKNCNQMSSYTDGIYKRFYLDGWDLVEEKEIKSLGLEAMLEENK